MPFHPALMIAMVCGLKQKREAVREIVSGNAFVQPVMQERHVITFDLEAFLREQGDYQSPHR